MDHGAKIVQILGPIEDRMVATVWRVLRHEQDAEDALQTAVATVWRQRRRIERHSNPNALILKICADAAIDQYRQRLRRRERHDVAALAGVLPAPGSDPAQSVVDREVFDDVMAAITRLPATRQRPP